MLPLRARVDLGVMAIKGYSAFPKFQHYWNLTIRLFSVKNRTLIWVGVGSYPSAEKQSVYSTAPANWAMYGFKYFYLIQIICTHLDAFKYSYLIQIISPQFGCFQVFLSNIIFKLQPCGLKEIKFQSYYYIHFQTNNHVKEDK